MNEDKIPKKMAIELLPSGTPKSKFGKRALSDQERLERSCQIADLTAQNENLELDKKNFANNIKAKMEANAQTVKEFSNSIRQGYEFTNVPCKKVMFPEYRYKAWYNMDTGELVEVEPMQPEDFQTTIMDESTGEFKDDL